MTKTNINMYWCISIFVKWVLEGNKNQKYLINIYVLVFLFDWPQLRTEPQQESERQSEQVIGRQNVGSRIEYRPKWFTGKGWSLTNHRARYLYNIRRWWVRYQGLTWVFHLLAQMINVWRLSGFSVWKRTWNHSWSLDILSHQIFAETSHVQALLS